MIVAVANQKGGTGKTTTVINLAHWFSEHDRRVLVIDFDVQGHVATCLGMPKGRGLYELLVNEKPIEQAATNARPGLDVVTSNKLTEQIKMFYSGNPLAALVIAQVIGAAAQLYDLTLLDLAPGSDLMHISALVSADWYLVPAKLDYLALDGVGEIAETVRGLHAIPSVAPPRMLGVLPTMFDRTTRETALNVRRLNQMVNGDSILPPIPDDTKIREAATFGKTVWEYAPRSAGAIGFKIASSRVNSFGNFGGYLHTAEIIADLTR